MVPRWLRRLLRRARLLADSPSVEGELDEELRLHIELEVRELVAEGWEPERARREALRRFGGVERTKERVRDERGGRMLQDVAQDLRYAVRTLRKSRGFTASALTVIALGVGATTALTAVVHQVLLEPLPYAEPGRLVRVWPSSPPTDEPRGWISYLNFQDWHDRATTLSHLGTWLDFPPDATLLRDGEQALQIGTVWIGGDFFGALGVQPLLGRWIEAEEGERSADLAVLSEGAWRRLFGADESIVGRTISLDFRSMEVVGVMPQSFAFPETDVDVWIPLTHAFVGRFSVVPRARGIMTQLMVGRLAEGATPSTVQSEMSRVARDLEREHPQTNAGQVSATVTGLHESLVGDVRAALGSLIGAAAFFLFLAAATLTNLVLVRGAGRDREIALRRSLGASRSRVARQLLTESGALSVAGGGLGLALAGGIVLAVRSGASGLLPRVSSLELDAAAGAIGVVVSVIITLVPALMLTGKLRTRDDALLGSSARLVSGDPDRVRQRRWLVGAEVALAVVLVVGAGLLIRSFQALTAVDPGFAEEGAVAMTLSVPAQKYDEPSAMRTVQEEILDGLRRLPGVAYAGATTDLPMRSSGEQYAVAIPGLYEPSEAEAVGITRLPVSIDGFRALGLPLIRGRHFTAADGPDDPLAIIVNERMARDFFMGQDPIGRQVTSTSGTGGRTVVGVVADVRQRGPGEEPPPTFYVPMAQETPRPQISYIARSSGDPLALIDAMRSVVREVDPDLPVTDVVTLDQLSAEVTAQPRFLAAVMAGFAVLASLLAVLGVYGVLAHAVRSRRREIGLRSALGASRSEVVRQVFMEGMAPAVGGLAVGLTGAALLSRYLESLLFSVQPLDAATFVVGTAMLAASAAVACIGPAVWAARVDPMVSLRGD